MASLESQDPKDSYQGLLKTTDDDAVGASKKDIVSGNQSATGLGLSTTKVFANTLQIENAPASSTNTNVATLNSSGDIETRSVPTQIFGSSLSDVIFARVDAGSSSATLSYVSTGSTTADSYAIGDSYSFNSADNGIIVEGSVNDVVEVTASLNLKFVQSDAVGRFSINQNGSPIVNSSIKNITQTSADDSSFNIQTPAILQTSSDTFTITYAATSGDITRNYGSYVKIQKFF